MVRDNVKLVAQYGVYHDDIDAGVNDIGHAAPQEAKHLLESAPLLNDILHKNITNIVLLLVLGHIVVSAKTTLLSYVFNLEDILFILGGTKGNDIISKKIEIHGKISLMAQPLAPNTLGILPELSGSQHGEHMVIQHRVPSHLQP